MPQSTRTNRLTIKPNRAYIREGTYDVQYLDNVHLMLDGEVIYSLSYYTFELMENLGYVENETQ